MDIELSPLAENIVTAAALSVIFCSLAIWITVLQRLWRRRPIVPLRPRRPVPWGLVHVILIFVIYLGLEFAAVMWAIGRAGGTLTEEGLSLAFDPQWMPVFFGAAAAAKIMALAVGAVMLYLTAGANGEDLGCGTSHLGDQLLLGIAGFMAIAPPVFAVQWLTSMWVEYHHPLIDLIQQVPSLGNLLLTTVLAALVAPLVEEFLFRLVLQGWLQKIEWRNRGGPWQAAVSAADAEDRIVTADLVDVEPASRGMIDGLQSPENPFASPAAIVTREPGDDVAKSELIRPGLPLLGVVPILISSLVFAMFHIGHGAAPIPLFVLSLALGFVYQRSGRLLPCIIIHMLLNSTSMAILWLSIYSPA